MNPYQVMGIIVGCTLVFAGVVTVLTMQGVPLLLAFLGVYLLAVWVMVCMQRKARELYDCKDHSAQRQYDRESTERRVRINDLTEEEEEVIGANQLHLSLIHI